jgi:hypothetical protein
MREYKRYIYTMRDYMKTPQKVKITPDGWITEQNGKRLSDPIPIEDYGDYMITARLVKNAFKQWCNYMEGLKNG